MYEMGQFIRLGDDPLTSRDGRHVLRYDDSGIATLTDTATGEIRWRAGAPGTLILGSGGVLHIEDPDGQPSWADLTHPDALNLVITDDGDLELLSGDGVRLVNSRTGAVEEPDPWEDWMWALMEERAYCATLIHGIEPADALRRLLGEDVKVHDGTWQDMQTLLGELDRDWEDTVVAAFRIGAHALLVEDNGWKALDRPDLAAGTFAVTCFSNVNAVTGFRVFRDGAVVADHTWDNGSAEPTTPEVRAALAAMGFDDPMETAYEHDLELFCRTAGVRVTAADVTGPCLYASDAEK